MSPRHTVSLDRAPVSYEASFKLCELYVGIELQEVAIARYLFFI